MVSVRFTSRKTAGLTSLRASHLKVALFIYRSRGGCADVFDAYSQGTLQAQLAAAGVSFTPQPQLTPQDLLPKWLHPRALAPA